jgi:hypothetical protein
MRRLLFCVLYGIAIGVFLFILGAFTGLPVFGEVIYDNSLSPHYNHTAGKVDFVTGPEMGDEITLGGTSRIVTQFDLALFVTNPISTGEIHFYPNDGSGGAPSTLLYDTGSINLIDGWNSLTGLSVTVPDTLTWTFHNLSTPVYGTFVGLQVYDPPTIGSSSGDFFGKSIRLDGISTALMTCPITSKLKLWRPMD